MVLPQPLSPTRPRTSSVFMSKVTLSTAWTNSSSLERKEPRTPLLIGNSFLRFLTLIMGVWLSLGHLADGGMRHNVSLKYASSPVVAPACRSPSPLDILDETGIHKVERGGSGALPV